MEKEEYQVPVHFGEEEENKGAPGKIATTTTSSSVASSSRVAASAASAPVRLGNNPNNTISGRMSAGYIDPHYTGMHHNRNEDTGTAATPEDGNSFNSSPLLWNSSTPQRIKSRRDFEQKIRHRRARATPNFPKNLNEGKQPKSKENDATSASLPLPKALTDILLHTAMAGIGTTAKLSRPTLELTKNTLLPQLIIPLMKEIWEQYVPIRLQTWMKVVPTSLTNVMNLLCDTEAGQALGEKAGQLGENVVDMASSDVARQCWIDATVALVKLLEGLHTPEVKALLDQFAVGMCRFVDVLSSGKAKQVWFDASDALWALIEVGSDPVMVMSLAEGCAQICFALERERESLKQRRKKSTAENAKPERLMASQRRRERDRRQMGTYPPGKAVVREGGGMDGFEEAWLAGLDGYIDEQEEAGIAEHDGPPQRVIVPTNSSENIGGEHPKEAESSFPSNLNGADSVQDEAIGLHVVNDDNESEITTEIEDLRCNEDPIDYDDLHTQSSASEKQKITNRQGNVLAYEQDGNGASLQNQIDQLDWRPNDDGTASEMYDTFDEPILQFYRKLNEVLVETRKQGKLDLQHSNRGDNRYKEDDKERPPISDSAANRDAFSSTPLVSKELFGVRKKWWKLFIVASICGVATMSTLWFVLGCYGFYVIFLGGAHSLHPPPPPMANNRLQSNIVIQLVTSTSPEDDKSNANADRGRSFNNNNGVASISLDDWNQLKLDVDTIIRQDVEKEDSLDGYENAEKRGSCATSYAKAESERIEKGRLEAEAAQLEGLEKDRNVRERALEEQRHDEENARQLAENGRLEMEKLAADEADSQAGLETIERECIQPERRLEEQKLALAALAAEEAKQVELARLEEERIEHGRQLEGKIQQENQMALEETPAAAKAATDAQSERFGKDGEPLKEDLHRAAGTISTLRASTADQEEKERSRWEQEAERAEEEESS